MKKKRKKQHKLVTIKNEEITVKVAFVVVGESEVRKK